MHLPSGEKGRGGATREHVYTGRSGSRTQGGARLGGRQGRASRGANTRVAGGIHEPAESVVTAIEDDPTENRILECALAADTELLVTGYKKHLLPLGFFRGISTVGLRIFLASFSAGETVRVAYEDPCS